MSYPGHLPGQQVYVNESTNHPHLYFWPGYNPDWNYIYIYIYVCVCVYIHNTNVGIVCWFLFNYCVCSCWLVKLIFNFSYQFLNQARVGRRPAGAWFLKIDPVWIVCMCVRVFACVCVCVSAPRLLITSGMMWCDMDSIQLVKQVL